MRTFLEAAVLCAIGLLSLRRAVFLVAACVRPRSLPEPDELPTVTVLVPARNEGAVVERLLGSLERLDYPPELLGFVLVCDGCSDGTAEAFRRWSGHRPGVRVLELPARRGKAAALNEALAVSASEVVVAADADMELRPDFLRRLVPALADGRVAAAGAFVRPANADVSIVAAYAAANDLVHQLVTLAGKDRLGLDPPTFGAAAYRRVALEAVGGFPDVPAGVDLEASLRLAREGWSTRFVPGAVADNNVVADLRAYRRQHVRWARGGFGALTRPARPARMTLPQRVESWVTGVGYGDRALLGVAAVGAAVGSLPAWAPAVYLAVPGAQLLAALLKAGLGRRIPRLFAASLVLFPLDLVFSVGAILVHLARRPHRWESLRVAQPEQ
jgi:glycosyl transferase family 2